MKLHSSSMVPGSICLTAALEYFWPMTHILLTRILLTYDTETSGFTVLFPSKIPNSSKLILNTCSFGNWRFAKCRCSEWVPSHWVFVNCLLGLPSVRIVKAAEHQRSAHGRWELGVSRPQSEVRMLWELWSSHI